MWSCILGAAGTTPRMAGVHCLRGPRSVVYMTDKLAQQFQKVWGGLSEQKKRGDERQYAVATSSDELIGDITAEVILKQRSEMEVLKLRDGSRFLVPTAVLQKIGATLKLPMIETDARSMRPYVRMLFELMQDLCSGKNDLTLGQVVRAYLDRQRLHHRKIRDLRRVGWALQVDDWLDKVMQEFDSDSMGSGTVSSVSAFSSTTGSDYSVSDRSEISFASEVDPKGVRRKRYDIAQLLYEHGVDSIAGRINDGVLDLREFGLTSIHDISMLTGALSTEQRNAITSIDLSGNDLQELEGERLWYFANLESIILKNNVHLNRIDPKAFAWLRKLRAIDLGSCGLTTLPDEVFDGAPYLEVLILEYNALTELPFLGRLQYLNLLSVHHNKLAQLPDLTCMDQLEVLNAAHNSLSSKYVLNLPRKGKLNCVLLNDNKLTRLTSRIMNRLPKEGMVNLSNNPMWQRSNIDNTNKLLTTAGYEAIDKPSREKGDGAANQVRDKIFSQVRDKLFDYLIERKLLKAKVIRDEISRRRPIKNIHTRAVDIGMWFYRYGGWFILGASLLFGGVGGIVGYMLKQLGGTVLKRVAIGAGIGAAVGAAAGYFGYNIWYDKRNFYLSGGGDDVYMTSELRAQYIGTFRLISLLALLQQYLVACNTCFYWTLNYDEVASDNDGIDKVMTRLQKNITMTGESFLGRTTDAQCVAMITQLIADNPITELRRHAPVDLFPASDMASQPLAEKATYAFLGIEKLTLVRSAICQFAKAARVTRSLLTNRYFGHADHAGVCKLAVMLEPLKATLRTVVDDVLEPTLAGMRRARHTADAWYTHVQGVLGTARETREFIVELEESDGMAETLRAGKGVRR